MKTCITFLLLTLTVQLMSQSSDTTFFPSFEPYSEEPIIHFGDEIEGSPWNDPTILKEGDQYIMYVVGVEGGLNHPNDTISVYRWLSDDGYSWDLNPELPVLEAVENTYYGGGVETPSVVFFNNEYHMYNSVYTENNPYLFKISHATSPDGINWEIDDAPVLEPAEDLTWMNTIVAEPGVMVKQDTLYLFYTAAGTVGNQSIGLVRSNDGHTFTDTTQVVTLPTDVYPEDGNYAGLSTPSPLLLGDTIYLFTDVAQYVFGDNWMQVALHQFKSYGNLTQWYHDSEPIHTRNDFPWTNGNYLAEIRSITPLMDGDNLRIWYSGHNISEIDTLTNDTTNHVFFIGDELHVNYGNWGIGTSEYLFDTSSSLTENKNDDPGIKISYHQNKGIIETNENLESLLSVYSITGKLLFRKKFMKNLNFTINHSGVIMINVTNEKIDITEKHLSTK